MLMSLLAAGEGWLLACDARCMLNEVKSSGVFAGLVLCFG